MSDMPDLDNAHKRVSNISELDAGDDVPPVTTIALDVKDRRGKQYRGSFYFGVPTIEDHITIGKMKAVYLGQGTPDINANSIADVLCYLTVCIRFDAEKNKKPEWWNPLKSYDLTPYSALYTRCLDYEAKFHGEGSLRGADEGAAQVADQPGGNGAVSVGRKVSAPTQRREALTGDGT